MPAVVTQEQPFGRSVDRVLLEAEALLGAGRAAEALALLAPARQQPDDARVLVLTSRALLALGRPGLAIGGLLLAAERQPGDADIHFALSVLLLQDGNPEQALVHGAQAFRLAPDHRQATALSAALLALGRYEQALAAAAEALACKPDHWQALANYATCLQGLGHAELAVPVARQAMAAAPPGEPVTRFNLGHALLGLGQMTPEAWALFEWRLLLDGNPARLIETAGLRWQGEDIAGRTILLQAEQGFGDTLQFVRYARWVGERAGRVVLAVQPALARLLRHVPGVDQVVPIGEKLPQVDVVCPLLSLPRLCGTTLGTIPAASPYADAFEQSRPPGEDTLRVGLVWAGSQTNKDDRARSLAPADLLALQGMTGVRLCSLQRHEPGRAGPPPALGVIDLMAGIEDFCDTAALVATLDLVISVDTAVAHLAATMGKPVWLLARWRGCWRWLHDRADSPWYPSMRVFRQTRPNDWRGVLEQVRGELGRMCAERGRSPRLPAPGHCRVAPDGAGFLAGAGAG